LANYFSDRTNIPFYDSLTKGEGRVVYLTPDGYIQATANLQGTGIQRQLQMVEPGLVDKYSSMMKKGILFDMPFIDVPGKSQEGRTRVLAAKKLGQKRVPVLAVGSASEIKLVLGK
jgi:hypothetical protein